MTPERRQQIVELYHAAQQRTGSEREALLAQAEPEVRREVESLMAHAGNPGSTPTTIGPGGHLGPYTIEALLGEGGMGRVFRAYDTRLRRTVAVKVLPQDQMASAERKRRFLREARAASALNHPNIMALYDIGAQGETDYLVMEHVVGRPLDKMIPAEGFGLAETIGYAVQIAGALGAAHAAGIVHRDVKPANLMVTFDGQVKVLDFGLAKLPETSPSPDGETRTQQSALTAMGSVMGSVSYMSPEQAAGRPLDHRTDIFSLGVVLYEMAAGRRPFHGKSQVETMHAIIYEQPPPLGQKPELEQIVARALAKDPQERYQNVGELAAELQRLQTSKPSYSATAVPGRSNGQNVLLAGAAVALAAACAGGFWMWREQASIAREKDKHRVEMLADSGAMMEAYLLAQRLDDRKPDDADMGRVWDRVGKMTPVRSDPPGADIYIRDYLKPASEWIHLGRTPLKPRLPYLFLSMRVAKDGYTDVERALGTMPEVDVKLTATDSTPLDMVLVSGKGAMGQTVALDDFWLDRHETSNAEYKKFIDAGGYRNRKFWKQPLIEGNREVGWDEAMKRFQDSSGRPGPAAWELGAYPEESANSPVSGVSWYEAAAYAEFAGKELPTVHHWRQAALYQSVSSEIVLLSNFAGKGPAPRGAYRGASFFGSYDMAGNVKEWCWNASGNNRFTLGGAWTDPSYLFNEWDGHAPFERVATVGFRCARYTRPVPEAARTSLIPPVRNYEVERPVSEEQFRIYKNLYAYDHTPLKEKIEATDDSDPVWKAVTVTFDAAYGDERVTAKLYLPKNAKPPYQTVVHFPGGYAFFMDKVDAVSLYWIRYMVQSGRAVLFPIYKGTYERRATTPLGAMGQRDQLMQICKDLGRSVDYLKTRSDIDGSKIGYHGFSTGAIMALPCVAVEDRFQTVILQGGGLLSSHPTPETDPFNFAPRIRVPVLMVNGKDDFQFPVSQQLPLFRFLGSAPGDKRHFLVEGGHVLPRNLIVKETLDWLDRYLGPAPGVP